MVSCPEDDLQIAGVPHLYVCLQESHPNLSPTKKSARFELIHPFPSFGCVGKWGIPGPMASLIGTMMIDQWIWWYPWVFGQSLTIPVA